MPVLCSVRNEVWSPPMAPGDWGALFRRLGLLVSMTLWPVVLWIQTRFGDDWSVTPHGNEPLFVVGKQSLVIWAVTSGAGLLLILLGVILERRRSGWEAVEMKWFPWLALWLINAYALYSYIGANAVAYG